MSHNPLISVVIPSYNHSKYISECIYSIFKQTYSPIELIIVDDESTDDSIHQIKNILSHKHPLSNTALICLEKNSGAHNAINTGLNLANGDFLAILNSDDVYHPNRITKLYNCAKSTLSEFIFSKVGYINDISKICSSNDLTTSKLLQIQKSISIYPSVSFSLLQHQTAISTGNFFFSKNSYQKAGGFNDLKYCHDWDFILRACAHFEPYYLDETLYYYRLHETNSFKSLNHVAENESKFILDSHIQRIEYHNYFNRTYPAPDNWPGVYEHILISLGYEKFQ